MQPVPVCLVACIFGMIGGSFLASDASQVVCWSFSLVPVLLLFFFLRHHPARIFLLFLGFFLAGLFRVSLALNPPLDLSEIAAYCGPDPVVVEGTVLGVNSRGEGRSSVDLVARQVSSGGIAAAVKGQIRLYVDSGPPRLLSGDRIRFRSRLRRPRTFGTPGEFNMPRHLAYSDIRVTAYLPDAQALVRLAGEYGGLQRRISRWRSNGNALVDDAVGVTSAPLVKALALGERGALSGAQREKLTRAGVAHLFAISGLHLGLLALLGYRGLLSLYRRFSGLMLWQPPQRVLPVLLLPLLFGYLLLTGDALATRRAFAACALAAVFLLWKRRVSPLHLLGTLALIFLMFEPLALWQASFQLSFAGVAGIVAWQPYWRLDGFGQPWLSKRILQGFLVSLAATIATAPLVILNFHQFSPAGLVNNIFAVPLVTMLAVPAGLAGLIFSIFWPSCAGPFFVLCEKVLLGVVYLADRVADIPGLDRQFCYLSRWQLALLFTGVALLFVPWRRSLLRPLILPVLILLLCAPSAAKEEGLSLTVFSVGQGESMLLSIDGGTHILVDGGGLYGDSFDVGERLLAPALGFLGVRRLDAVLLTHAHPDHSQGLRFLLQNFPVDTFWCGAGTDTPARELRPLLEQRQIPVRRFSPGWTDVRFGDVMVSLYVPELVTNSQNDRSVAVYVRRGDDGLLLTGDLEQAGAAALLSAGVPAPVSLLKLPHHGSRHSGARQFIRHLQPKLVVASVGYQNPYRFPAPDVVDNVLTSGATLYRTDLSGTLKFFTQGQGWQVEQWRDGLFR